MLLVLLPVLAVLANGPSVATAADNNASITRESTNAVAKAEKAPPLPLHQIEGNGGIFSTLSAYLVNPPRNGEWLGRPSVGFAYVRIGHGRDLEALTLTETPWKRLELGYGFNHLDLGDLPTAIALGGGPQIAESVELHHANARLQLLKENEFDQKWPPALTAGYGHFGTVANHEANGVWGLTTKWEF